MSNKKQKHQKLMSNNIRYILIKPIIIKIFLLVLLQWSCTNHDAESIDIRNVERIAIDSKNKNLKVLILDSLVDENSTILIPLETNDLSIFGASYRLNVVDSGFLVIDKGLNKILQFDFDGTYHKTMGGYGKGPEEYLDIIDSHYNPYNKTVDIYDKSLRLIQFDLLTGKIIKYKKRFSKDFNIVFFYPTGPDSYALYNHFIHDGGRLFRFGYMDHDRIVTNRLSFKDDKIKITGSKDMFYTYKDTTRFFERFIPLIYNVINGDLSARYYLDFNMDKQDSVVVGDPKSYTDLKYTDPDMAWLDRVQETDRLLFIDFSVSQDRARRYCIFDKAMGKSLGASYDTYYFNGIKVYIQEVIANKLIGTISPVDLISMQKKTGLKHNNELSVFERRLLKLSIKETDNLIIISMNVKQ